MSDSSEQSIWNFPTLIAVIGMIVTITGLFLHDPIYRSMCFTGGGLFLLLSSYLVKEWLYLGLQVVVVVGASLGFASWHGFIKAFIPIIIATVLILVYFFRGLLKDKNSLLGALGIMVLASGYAILHPILYFSGSVVLSIYSAINYRRGIRVALIWLVLNVVFVIVSSYEIIMIYGIA